MQRFSVSAPQTKFRDVIQKRVGKERLFFSQKKIPEVFFLLHTKNNFPMSDIRMAPTRNAKKKLLKKKTPTSQQKCNISMQKIWCCVKVIRA
jgi:hypothetical protein